jgi:GT2 family glycosyltransferase
MQTREPFISVVIPTYKAVDCLMLCVRSLVRCEGKEKLEVCLYGDGGGEASRKALEECRQMLESAGLRFHVIYNPQNLGNTPAVNRVVAMATGDWFFLCNDDMVFPKNWLSVCGPLLQKNRVLSMSCIEPPVCGHQPCRYFYAQNMGIEPERFSLGTLDDFNKSIAQKEQALEAGVNYPFFAERELFLGVGGADERFSGPYHDPDLFLRFRLHGVEMLRTQACALYHFSGMSLRFLEQNAAQKKRKQTLKWVVQENEARLKFIGKWGAKPRARFGEIPRTRVQKTFDWESAPLWRRLSVSILLFWEHFRGRIREKRYSKM